MEKGIQYILFTQKINSVRIVHQGSWTMKNAIKLIKIIFTDFVVKEMCLQNPRKMPAEP